MKKNKTTIILLIFFFIGLLLLLYPSLSNLYNKKFQSEAIVYYENILDKFKQENYDEEFNKAIQYNIKLSNLIKPLYNYKKINDYDDILNVSNNGMMGYLSISKIGVELPIYHGTDKSVLSLGVGHLKGTSLPVGETGSHSVLMAHRGLPSSKLFTDLDKLEIGDIFTISVLNKELTYEIDSIKIVKPYEVQDLKIDKNEDYVTLITCTPYGINTHRLLVRGTRVESIPKPKYITTEAFRISSLTVAPILALPIIFISILILIFKPVKKDKDFKYKYIYPTSIKKE